MKDYDQFGGAPYGVMVGLYDFSNTSADLTWLRAMGKIAAASHAPFISAVSPKFFGCESMQEVNQLRDLTGLFATPRYSAWNAFRDSAEATYIGLTLPRYMVRPPYDDRNWPAEGIKFNESVRGDNDNEYRQHRDVVRTQPGQVVRDLVLVSAHSRREGRWFAHRSCDAHVQLAWRVRVEGTR
ncbi:MAG: type VI secretion system contractile sheath large subunit [Polyangiaceae bacterium]